MKKIITLILFCFGVFTYAKAQTTATDTLNNYNDKADYQLLGKVWGFLKYHHPNVTRGQFDWDGQLLNLLPEYQLAVNKADRNKLLLKWINGLGNVPVFPIKNTVIADVKFNADLSWINSSNFSPEMLSILNNLKNNHSTASQRYIKFMSDEGIVFQTFVNEPAYAAMKFPGYRYRLLAAFRYWNIVSYWYPYRYLSKPDWEKALTVFTRDALAARDAAQYAHFIQKMIASIGDTHAVISSTALEQLKGKYQTPFTVKIIEGKAIVNAVNADYLKGADVQRGYTVESVNGQQVKQIITGLLPYVSASTKSAAIREAARLITRTNDTLSNIVLRDNNNKQHTLTIKNIPYSYYIPKTLDFPHQQDSAYYVMSNNILYVNTGKITRAQIPLLKPILSKIKGIVFDNRQYPQSGAPADLIADLLLSQPKAFARFSSAVAGYPGTFKLVKPLEMGAEKANSYTFKIAVLVNEETQSTGEFYSMFLRALPNAVVVGSETAGADGNVVQFFMLPGGFNTRFTGLGVYYSDGRETQQIGVVPDVKLSQTIKGYRAHTDELLEKAVEVILSTKK